MLRDLQPWRYRTAYGSNMSRCGIVLVLGEHVSDGRDIEAGAAAKPVKVANNMSEVCFGFVKDSLWEMRRWWYLVDGIAQVVWGAGWRLRGEVKRGDEGINRGLLREVYGDVAVGVLGGGNFVAKEMSGSVDKVDEHFVVFG